MTGDAMFNLTIESNDSSDYTAGMTELAWLFWLMRKPRIQGPSRHRGDQWSQDNPGDPPDHGIHPIQMNQ